MFRILYACLILFGSFLGAQENIQKKYKIGVCVLASGQENASALIESGRRFFCLNHDVLYIVFTDGVQVLEAKDVVLIPHSVDTLRRCHLYEDYQRYFETCDYVFSMSSDMVFTASVGEEILSELVAVQHPFKKRTAYESRKNSTAYVGPQEGTHYYTAGFYGGSRREFLKLLKTVKKQMDIDLGREITARFQEESYLNRYFLDHPPTKILNASYCYPENWQMDCPKKITTRKIH
ncbi:MAG TPA: hypothetical protein VHA52_00540 [Candidatus Babeliaceae bacterium]|nr:hypothetical protein [Candidatus Babeliaceae bacterium]